MSTPQLLPGHEVTPAAPVFGALASDAKPGSKAVVHFTVPIGDPGVTTTARLCGATLDKMLRPNTHITSISLSGKTQFGSGVPVTAQQMATNVGVVVARRHKTDPSGSERIPTIGDTQRQFSATHFENGVGVLGAHMHVNGASTRETTLHCKRPTNLSDEDLTTMKNRYDESVLNMTPSQICDAHEPHKRFTPDPKTGAQRVGYVIPITDDGSSNGPTPMHAFLASRSANDPALANKITILGKDHAVFQEGDFHTIANGLSANTQHDDVTRGAAGNKRELMFQIKNPEHSHINEGDAVAMLTATLSTNAAAQDGALNEEGQPQVENPLDAELDRAINAKLGGGYKNVFNPTDHIAVLPENVTLGSASTTGGQSATGADSATASSIPGNDSDEE